MAFLYDQAKDIIERGQLWYGDNAIMKRGLPSRCHYNSAKIWETDKEKYRVATGYALSPDGMWRQHSWVIEVGPKENRIIETTEFRVAYFGMVLTDEEAETLLRQEDI